MSALPHTRTKRLSVAEMTAARRSVVYQMHTAGRSLDEISLALRDMGLVNPNTKKGFSRQTLKTDIKLSQPQNVRYVNGIKTYHRSPVAEMIGAWTYIKPLWPGRILLNVDTIFKDYPFWDSLRRGMAPGYAVGGLFCMPIAQTITSYMMGSGLSGELMESATPSSAITVSLNENGKPTKNLKAAKPNGKAANGAKPQLSVITNPKPNPNAGDAIAYTNAQMKLFFKRNQGFLQTVQTDKFCLGNQYAVVNPDCSLSLLSPETVTVEYAASDYRHPVKYIIRTKMEKARVEDIYEADKRTLIIHYYDGTPDVKRTFENLIGRIPIVHFTCDRSANEIYGRPVYEAALPLMQRYDDLVDKTSQGLDVLAMPVPVFEGLKDIDASKKFNSTPVPYTDEMGNQQVEYVTRFDRNAGLWLGDGAKASMLYPPVGFTKDTLDFMRQLFLLLLNYTRIPEFIWGGAIASSKASAEAQMPPFLNYIKFRRIEAEGEGADPALNLEARGGILELMDIWLRTYKLLNPTIVVGPIRLKWPEIDLQNEQIKYMWGTFFRSLGDLNQVQALDLSGYWDDPEAVAASARGDERRQPNFDDYDKRLRKARLAAARENVMAGADKGTPFSTDYYTSPEDREGNNQIEGDLLPSNDPSNPFGAMPWQNQFSGNY